MNLQRALFLDRDGVINVDGGYVHSIEKFEFIQGIFDLCKAAQSVGFCLVVVTNQAGIGKGYFQKRAYQCLTQWMWQQFEHSGAALTDVYFCPYHPEGVGRYKRDSFFRKPNPGMLFLAAKQHGIELRESVLVGDRTSDILAGQAAGVKVTIQYNGPGASTDAGLSSKADMQFASHRDISRWFLREFS